MSDLSQTLREQVLDAREHQQPVSIQGNNTKGFLGNSGATPILDTSAHSGILHYEPTELVLTARAGTLLSDITQCLDEHQQMLAFEPPGFGDKATLGGTIACNLSGPRRPYAGAARDFVLGCCIINGQGQVLKFGGEVMKNVAGYDVSRLMTGAMGTLGILLDISIKVVPKPPMELTIRKEVDNEQALQVMSRWRQRPMPVSAACHDGNHLYFRLSGSESALKSAQNKMGGDRVDNGEDFWERLREHKHAFFDINKPLWRLSLPANTPLFNLDGKQFIDWGGAQRWLVSSMDADKIRALTYKAGGHASLYRRMDSEVETFHPLPEAMLPIHQRIKQAFDPDNIFNPGRMYKTI